MSDDLPQEPVYVPGAGAQLRAGREAAGLSIDAVAQQLKLAPRQVVALEEDDHASLPGRTFVRGFARNYARFLRLDPEAIVAALPESEAVTTLEHPTLAPMPQPMGEMPIESGGSSKFTRNLLIALLVGALGLYLGYDYLRGGSLWKRGDGAPVAATPAATEARPAAAAPASGPQTPGVATSALPNPLDGARNDAPPAGAGEKIDPVMGPATTVPGAPTLPAGPPTEAPGIAPKGSSMPGAATTPAGAATASMTAPPPAAATGPALTVSFSGTSWIEVKDSNGSIVLSLTGAAGSSQTVNAAPPLDVVIGNARQVNLSYRGQAVDLGPHIRQNVARLSLR